MAGKISMRARGEVVSVVAERYRAAERIEKGPDSSSIRDALIALWEASDRLCGKRLTIMIPTLLPALERHDRLKLSPLHAGDRVPARAICLDDLP